MKKIMCVLGLALAACAVSGFFGQDVKLISAVLLVLIVGFPGVLSNCP